MSWSCCRLGRRCVLFHHSRTVDKEILNASRFYLCAARRWRRNLARLEVQLRAHFEGPCGGALFTIVEKTGHLRHVEMFDLVHGRTSISRSRHFAELRQVRCSAFGGSVGSEPAPPLDPGAGQALGVSFHFELPISKLDSVRIEMGPEHVQKGQKGVQFAGFPRVAIVVGERGQDGRERGLRL